MSKFYNLIISEVKKETPDCVSIAFDIPDVLKNDFTYKQGQYLTFLLKINNEEIRRSYSLCSSPYIDEPMRVAVKEVSGGKFSVYANRNLKKGDVLQSMAPAGNFFTELNSSQKKHYVAFAAGSGITPVYSILKSVLQIEPHSKFTLIYSNKNAENTIFKNELDSLVKTNKQLEVIYLFSRQDTGNTLLNGRIDKNKAKDILNHYGLNKADEYFICGPEELIFNIADVLHTLGISKNKIHFELFTTPVLFKNTDNDKENKEQNYSGNCNVTVIMDGIETSFTLNANGENILDAALNAGADVPFSCKGAVCCTCKAKIIEGKANMDMNYSLTDKEVAEGYILTCQAHPQSPKLVVDYDVS